MRRRQQQTINHTVDMFPLTNLEADCNQSTMFMTYSAAWNPWRPQHSKNEMNECEMCLQPGKSVTQRS